MDRRSWPWICGRRAFEYNITKVTSTFHVSPTHVGPKYVQIPRSYEYTPLITPKKLSKNLPAEFACEAVLRNLHVNTFLQNSHVNTFPQNLQVNTKRFQNFLTTLTVRHTHIHAYQLRNRFYILYTTVLQAN